MIEVRDLKKSFGTHEILDGVSFCIEKGESVVIIGRSGGGKSVLLKHLIGLLKPESGQVLIDGENIVSMNEREILRVRSKFGMLFQGAALFDSMTVAENVAFAFRRNRRGCKAFATGSEALFVDLLPRADVITGEDTVYLASVKALPVD